MIPDLQVMNENDSMSTANMCVDNSTGVFSCTITRAVAKHTRDEESTELLVNLGDTFLAHSNMFHKLPSKIDQEESRKS